MKIYKNIIYLYGRSAFSILIALYTSRITLRNLGVEDFGIYNIVGGVVVIMAFLNHAMTASTQRFLTFELQNQTELLKIFNNSKSIHLVLAIVILILGEILGVYFINNYLLFSENRRLAINFAYQFSLISFIINIINVPYYALVIAYEDLNFFTLIGAIEAILKLIAAYIITFTYGDNLITYSFFVSVISVFSSLSYNVFSRYKYKVLDQSRYEIDVNVFKKLSAFAGWNLLGVFAGVGYNNGVNILLNIFFGAQINAARAISFQIQNAINNVTSSIHLAFNSSITKSYSNANPKEYFNLIFLSTKLSFLILVILIFPLYLNLNYILEIWLENVPNYTSLFIKIILIEIILNSIASPLHTIIQATGNIKLYQILVSTTLLLNLPISYLLLICNFGPEITFYVSLSMSLLALIFRIIILKRIISFDVNKYFVNVLLPIIFTTFFISLLIIVNGLINLNNILYSIIALPIIIIITYCVLLNRLEKSNIKKLIFKKLTFNL